MFCPYAFLMVPDVIANHRLVFFVSLVVVAYSVPPKADETSAIRPYSIKNQLFKPKRCRHGAMSHLQDRIGFLFLKLICYFFYGFKSSKQ